ncbi:hypothetical protein H9P43_000701 [Blastocladiella emersonii ATCC 22665]|nr:hypothetical protein H9P43_000701 [Blastocladiella emersonii ATCC 22665]
MSQANAIHLRVGFQGIRGAYSEAALLDFYRSKHSLVRAADPDGTEVPTSPASPVLRQPRGTVEPVAFPDFASLFDAVELGTVDRALVPVENTHSGSFPEIHALLRERTVHVTAEYVVREHHCLVGHEGTKLEDLTEIRSHPAVLAQCRAFLRQLSSSRGPSSPPLTITQAMDTAESAAYVARVETPRAAAAIASRDAAALYGLSILAEDMEDTSTTLVTRYYELSAQPGTPPPPRDGQARTALAITLRNVPGALFKALSCFALREINVSKVESRPLGHAAHPWELVFVLTVDGAVNEEPMRRALANLEEYVASCKLLGSFASSTQPPHRYARIYGSRGTEF